MGAKARTLRGAWLGRGAHSISMSLAAGGIAGAAPGPWLGAPSTRAMAKIVQCAWERRVLLEAGTARRSRDVPSGLGARRAEPVRPPSTCSSLPCSQTRCGISKKCKTALTGEVASKNALNHNAALGPTVRQRQEANVVPRRFEATRCMRGS